MTTQDKAAGLPTRAASKELLLAHLTARLAKTKRLLVHAYASGALTFDQAEHIANALRRKFGFSWRRA
jgi:hypothetical protein